MYIKSLIVFSVLFLSGITAQNQGSSDDKRNPIVSLFEAPLKAFRTRPGEAIAVFQPEVIKVQPRQQNGTDSPSSWFPSELGTIGSAAQSLLPGWLSGRTTTTTPKPEIIIQVHQNDRHRQHPILNIGPVNGNSNEEDDDDNSDEDREDDEDDDDEKVGQKKKRKQNKKPVNFRRRRPILDDDDDDDDDDLDDDFNDRFRRPNRRRVVVQRRRGDSYYSDQMQKRKKIDANRIPLTDRIFLIDDDDFIDDIEFLHRNFGKKEDDLDSPYYNVEDDDLPSIPQNDGRKLGGARYGGPVRRRQQPNRREQQNNRKEHRDTVDEINIRMKLKNPNLQQKEITEEEIDNEIRKELIREEKLRRQRLQQNRRKQQNNANRPNKNSDRLPMNDFLKPFQDIPPLTRPIKYGPNTRRKPIGILQQEERDRKKKQQQQREKEKEEKEQEEKFEVQFEFDNEKQQRPFHQSQHILIPIHVVPQSIPYKEVVPQVVPQHIQVVAQHHHTVEHSENEGFKPSRGNKKKKKQPVVVTYEDDDDDDDDDENESVEEEEVFYNRVPIAHSTRRPINNKSTTRRPANNKNKKNKFVVNRHKPTLLKQAEAPKKNQPARENQKPAKDVARPVKESQKPLKEAQRPMKEVQRPLKEVQRPMKEAQKPMKENEDPKKDNDRPDFPMSSSEEMNSEEKPEVYSNAPFLPPGLDSIEDDDMKESKEGEGRAQYYLPQRYFQILGTDKYLAVGNTGKFLLKTGRKLENNESEVEKSEADKKEEVAKVEEVKVDEVKVKEDVPAKVVDKGSDKKPEAVKEESKSVPADDAKKIVEEEHKLDLVISTTTERPIIVKPTEKVVPVTIVKAEENPAIKNIEKVLVKSEIVQEKQNGHFVVRSEPKERSFRR